MHHRLAIPLLLLCASAAFAFDKLSPFTEVRFEGEKPVVVYQGKRYVLAELDGVKADTLVAFCKKAYGGKWEKRFAEDLVEVMTRMGKAPGHTVELVLHEHGTGKRVEVAAAAMTKENRRAVLEARHRPAALTKKQVAEDVAELVELLKDRYSYLARNPAVLKGLVAGAPDGGSVAELALFLQKQLARFGDGHTRVGGIERFLPRRYLPFLVGLEGEGGRLVAFRPGRDGFVSDAHPYLKSIDGVPVERWHRKAGELVAHGSPQYRRWYGARRLRQLGWLRSELGLPDVGTVRVELASADGKVETVELPVAARKPTYGSWPRRPTGVLEDGIGYARIPAMDPRLSPDLARLRDTKALIVDVRGNGGGVRDVLRDVAAFVLTKPRVVNVARYRLPPGEPRDDQGHLENRFLYPRTWKGWGEGDLAAIRAFAKGFRPEWKPPQEDFTDWHYMVVRPGPDPYGKPVVILMDPWCFSATDVFLGAFRGVPNVTLLGAPSGGGSGRARRVQLGHSRLAIRVSSMASFQPSGKLYDGNGVQPDVLVWPVAADWIGRTDTVLDAALARLR